MWFSWDGFWELIGFGSGCKGVVNFSQVEVGFVIVGFYLVLGGSYGAESRDRYRILVFNIQVIEYINLISGCELMSRVQFFVGGYCLGQIGIQNYNQNLN